MTSPDRNWGRADLQIHTDASDGMDGPLTIIAAALERGLDTIAITDHDQVRGAHLAREIAAKHGYPIDIIVASEVTSRHGHILALWIEEPIPAFKTAAQTVEAIWKQGGAAIIAHPAAVVPFALTVGAIDRLVQNLSAEQAGDDPPILALETANPIPSARWRRHGVIARNDRWQLPATGGSDAHFHEQVGAGLTRYQGRGQRALRSALSAAATTSELQHYPSLRDIGALRLLRQQWRGISATPRALIGRRLGQGR